MKKSFGIFILFLVLYSVTISRVPSISNDSINYISSVDSGEWFFHPHHLLYHVTALEFYKLLKVINPNMDSVIGIAILNAIFGALCIALIYRMMRELLKFTGLTSFIVSSIIGFSYGFWFYSCCVEVYIIPLFLILLGYYQYFRWRESNGGVISAAFLFSFAILFHQVYALLILVLWIMLLFDKPKRKLNNFVLSGLIIAIIPSIVYLFIMKFRYGLNTPSEMYGWMTLYGHRMAYLWNKPSLQIIPMISFGFFRALFSIHPIYKSQFFLNLYNDYGRNHFIEDDIFLVRNLNPAFFYIYLALIVTAVVLILYLLISNRSVIKQNFMKNRLVMVSFAIFQLVFSLFFSFWDSTNLEFWIPQTVFFWMMLFILIRNDSRFRINTYLSVSLLFLILFINWYSTIRFVDSIENDYYYHVVRETEKQARPGDLIIFAEGWIIKDYYKKYSDLNVYTLDQAQEKNKWNKMESVVNNALAKGNVIAESDIIDYLKNKHRSDIIVFWDNLITKSTQKTFIIRDQKFIKLTMSNHSN